jgi:glycogen debranching enzyme
MTDPARQRLDAQDRSADANVWSEYEIEPHSSLVDRPLRNLKHGEAFAVVDSTGDIGVAPNTAEGLFYRDTRYLSHFEFRIEGQRPLLLSSVVQEDKSALTVDLTNPDLQQGRAGKLPRDTIAIERTRFLWKAVCYERLGLKNFGASAKKLQLDFLYGADFHDLFEVRGTKRRRRGRKSAQILGGDEVELRYEGLDGIVRRTTLRFSPPPRRIDVGRATLDVTLEPGEQAAIFITIACSEGEPVKPGDFFLAYRGARRARRASMADIAAIATSNDVFDEVMSRATSDVYTLVTRTDLGPYPFAGIPWFSTFFGRDGIITAMFMLWVDPDIARDPMRSPARSCTSSAMAKWPISARSRSAATTAPSMPRRSS